MPEELASEEAVEHSRLGKEEVLSHPHLGVQEARDDAVSRCSNCQVAACCWDCYERHTNHGTVTAWASHSLGGAGSPHACQTVQRAAASRLLPPAWQARLVSQVQQALPGADTAHGAVDGAAWTSEPGVLVSAAYRAMALAASSSGSSEGESWSGTGRVDAAAKSLGQGKAGRQGSSNSTMEARVSTVGSAAVALLEQAAFSELDNNKSNALEELARASAAGSGAYQAVKTAEQTGNAARVAAAFGRAGSDGAISEGAQQGVLKLLAAAQKLAWADSSQGWQAAAEDANASVLAHGRPGA